jgi:hypothetical protein
MSAILYTGEAAGSRIFRYGVGIVNVGQVGGPTDYQFDATTWDIVPATEVGDVVFRSIDATFKAVNGYYVGITPIIDGIPLPEQAFSASGSGEVEAQAFIAARGTRIAARLRTLGRSGDIEFHNLATSFQIIRSNP